MEYSVYGFNLSDAQKKQISNAVKNKNGMNLRLMVKNLEGNDKLKITTRQASQILKAMKAKKGVVLRLSAKQLSASKKISGGFLPALLGALAPTLLPMAVDMVSYIFQKGRGGKGVRQGTGKGKGVRSGTGTRDPWRKNGTVMDITMSGEGCECDEKKNTMKGWGLRILE